ncbi:MULTISPECIES: PadR family transcriptional regulator [Aerococcus]|uniref:PadR family transcriptional regulator n=4 Tax=Lactobacillales TaxID=186826 RepID=A0ABT4C375_9LACT|nr:MULTISPECIES: PadR family transcriptional regulator [Aerococcus]AEA01469.1 transcriptional regulator, PadR family [Aerococcus sp. Group 1]AMB96411.1 PadR family transcriptional regulator [Aerococcus urinae]KAA9234138.1 PadR family transcriptional regulator [Aerococcus mictus]KAA9242043.1 PadR family transcriptional regulator [Aerococcus urinae]KAA9293105.1 PadR family transcriptional regulator [Aerococcus mictus]
MNSQLKKGVLEMLVLQQLRERDCYGYELVQEISEHIAISEGTIYPLLRRLNKEALVTTYLKESESGPPRKYYKISSQGLATLQEQIAEWQTFVQRVNAILEGG